MKRWTTSNHINKLYEHIHAHKAPIQSKSDENKSDQNYKSLVEKEKRIRRQFVAPLLDALEKYCIKNKIPYAKPLSADQIPVKMKTPYAAKRPYNLFLENRPRHLGEKYNQRPEDEVNLNVCEKARNYILNKIHKGVVELFTCVTLKKTKWDAYYYASKSH